jgi:mannose-6-phosphate isomerase-like protein (cupin superfamily)
MADFVLRHWTLEPGTGDQAPPHIHHRSDEGFIVLRGELEVLSGRERQVLAAGQSLIVPAGTIHTFGPRGAAPVMMIGVLTPEIDELIAALHQASPGIGADAIWTRHHAAIAAPG